MLLSDGSLFFTEFTDEDMSLEMNSLCVLCERTAARNYMGLSVGVWQSLTTAAAFILASAGKGHPEQSTAYANGPQLWPSAR